MQNGTVHGRHVHSNDKPAKSLLYCVLRHVCSRVTYYICGSAKSTIAKPKLAAPRGVCNLAIFPWNALRNFDRKGKLNGLRLRDSLVLHNWDPYKFDVI